MIIVEMVEVLKWKDLLDVKNQSLH